MSLQLIERTRIENLATELVDELTRERAAKGPSEFLKVAVVNPNLSNLGVD